MRYHLGQKSMSHITENNKTQYVYSTNHHEGMGKLRTHSPTYCMIDNSENIIIVCYAMFHCWGIANILNHMKNRQHINDIMVV